ncbi:MAG TPA: serpin family protein, partial [Candidatus Obscuribacterales bacterium]
MENKLIAPTADFGFNLLRAEVARKPEENVFISPLSVSLALGMTYNGARGKTQQEMAAALGLDASDLAAANLGYANLLAE